jgi:predicted extracellular nuclease
LGMLFRYIYFLLIMALPGTAATNFTIATFNVENYFLSPFETRKKKTEVSREKVSDIIMTVRPDVLALQEIG